MGFRDSHNLTPLLNECLVIIDKNMLWIGRMSTGDSSFASEDFFGQESSKTMNGKASN